MVVTAPPLIAVVPPALVVEARSAVVPPTASAKGRRTRCSRSGCALARRFNVLGERDVATPCSSVASAPSVTASL